MKKIICSIMLVGLCVILCACSSKGSSRRQESSYSYSSYTYESSRESSRRSSYETSSRTKTKKTCIACHGTGIIRQYETNDPYDPGYLMECVACHGKGYYYD